MYGLALALSLLAVLILTLLVVEIRQYRSGRHFISRRRFALRVVAGILMLILLAAVFVGLFILNLRDAQARPSLFMGYWFGCIIIAVALVWIMLADMQDVEDRLSQRQNQMWRDMARFVADSVSRGKRDRGDAEDREKK